MAAPKRPERPAVDPLVADLLRQGDQRQADRRQPLDDRRRKTKEREKARARNRVMLDMPQDLEERIKAIAEQHSCPISQVATLLLRAGLIQLDKGVIDIEQHKEPSKSPRYLCNLKDDLW